MCSNTPPPTRCSPAPGNPPTIPQDSSCPPLQSLSNAPVLMYFTLCSWLHKNKPTSVSVCRIPALLKHICLSYCSKTGLQSDVIQAVSVPIHHSCPHKFYHSCQVVLTQIFAAWHLFHLYCLMVLFSSQCTVLSPSGCTVGSLSTLPKMQTHFGMSRSPIVNNENVFLSDTDKKARRAFLMRKNF